MIESTIISQLIFNEEFIKKVLPFLRTSYFGEKPDKILFKTLVEYYRKYNHSPTLKELAHEVSERTDLSDDEFSTCLHKIDSEIVNDEEDFDWLVDKTEQWCQDRAMYNAVNKAITIIDGEDENNTPHAIPDLMREALAISFDTELGHDYIDDAEARFEYYNSVEHKIPFRLSMFNKITNGGIPKKTLNIILGGTNIGKAQPINTPILTSLGWSTMGDLKIGDFVYGKNGKLTKVTGVFPQGKKDVYEINFADGRKTKSCKEHLWNVHVKNKTSKTMELSDIINRLKTKTYKNRLYIPLCDPLEFNSIDKIIPPYMMGLYLGDGTTRHRCIGFSSSDDNIIDRLQGLLDCGYKLNQVSKYDYNLKKPNNTTKNKYTEALRDYDLFFKKSHEKFIPHEYINQSSIDERWDLLSGLIDSDGYISKSKTLHYYTTSEKLRDGVIELVRSLGGIASYKNKQTSYNISIRLNPNNKLSISKNKKNINDYLDKTKPLKLRIDNVKYHGQDDCVCIKVEADDSLYVTENYIVTHNTMILCSFAADYLRDQKNVLYITLEMAEEEIANRIDANMMQMEVNDVQNAERDIFFKNVERVKKQNVGKIIIKQYPTSQAHEGHFRTFLQELKLKKKFIPDIIIIDYIGITASSRVKLGQTGSYGYVKAVAEEVRGLAVESDVTMWSAVQTNRDGFGSSDPDLTNTAESFGLPATADFMLAAVRTDELDALGQILWIQLKSRFGNKSRYNKFTTGVNVDQMTLFDVDQNAQNNIVQTVNPSSDKPKSESKFKGIEIE